MANLEKKIYSSYAFSENERQKMKVNNEIYEQIKKKWRISNGIEKYNAQTKRMEEINFNDFDLVYVRKPCYRHAEYCIKKNVTNMTDDELALIFDEGNLCFGYRKVSEVFYRIFED